MNNTQLHKKTATSDERQFKSKKLIMNDIIKILADNNLTITDSKDILHETSKVICEQKVILPTIESEWISANDFRNTIST